MVEIMTELRKKRKCGSLEHLLRMNYLGMSPLVQDALLNHARPAGSSSGQGLSNGILRLRIEKNKIETSAEVKSTKSMEITL